MDAAEHASNLISLFTHIGDVPGWVIDSGEFPQNWVYQ